jgi:hypothetical protein
VSQINAEVITKQLRASSTAKNLKELNDEDLINKKANVEFYLNDESEIDASKLNSNQNDELSKSLESCMFEITILEVFIV